MLDATVREADRALILAQAVLATARSLGLAQEKVAQALEQSMGIAGETAERMGIGAEGEEDDTYPQQLRRLYCSLGNILDWSMEDAKKWLLSVNGAFDGKRPLELLDDTAGVIRLVSYLERYGVSG
ncbi:hypothetical protein GMLC_01690 [Geomonas limicola]|uniref:Antitoxin Xre/MbcA/ParS-like toxin-binding domain-containing protein n=1 Tax=Geomonas limicola TaxID=2740186 RepID=A0A6V8N2K7_9BACT|nr:antitoxin Xre/MbcA/ParS toxin-binding domain-containing protein [Geomonas limicola]GFO66590.1 hypothetical protein GMLC_01690 [Geomonas limicola]